MYICINSSPVKKIDKTKLLTLVLFKENWALVFGYPFTGLETLCWFIHPALCTENSYYFFANFQFIHPNELVNLWNYLKLLFIMLLFYRFYVDYIRQYKQNVLYEYCIK
jgi:hypothetical protein